MRGRCCSLMTGNTAVQAVQAGLNPPGLVHACQKQAAWLLDTECSPDLWCLGRKQCRLSLPFSLQAAALG